MLATYQECKPAHRMLILLLGQIFLLALPLEGQQVQLRGRVSTEDGKPLFGATVRLLDGDSVQHGISLVDSLGRFVFGDVGLRRGILSVRYIGLQEVHRAFSLEHPSDTIFDFVLKERVTALDEAIIEGKSQRFDGKWQFVLSPEQKKRSYTGYDIIYNLMIPGVSVDKRSQSISMLGIELPVYIDGRRANSRELSSLRKHEIDRVDFYDFPTGRFSGDVASINIITRKVSGGHLSVDLGESLGETLGEHNLVSKYNEGQYTWAVWTGMSHKAVTTASETTEVYATAPSPTERMQKLSTLSKDEHYYLQSSLSYRAKNGNILMIRPGFGYTAPHLREHGKLSSPSQGEMDLLSISRTSSPNLLGYGYFVLSSKQSIETSIDGVYHHNRLNRTFSEGVDRGQVGASEDIFNMNVVGNYTNSLGSRSTLSVRLSQHYKNSRTEYDIEGHPSTQALRSYESILFVGFSQSVSNSLMYRLQAGGSLQYYELKGYSSHLRISPRLSIALLSQRRGRYSAQIGVDVGNTFPNIATLNQTSYRLNAVAYTRGNPDLGISTLIGPFGSYTLRSGKVSLSARVNYLCVVSPVVRDYRLENDYLVKSYVNSGYWHDLKGDIATTWRISPSLDIRTSLKSRYISHPVSGASIFSLHGSSDVNLTLGDWYWGASIASPRKTLSSSLVEEYIPWTHTLMLGYTHKGLQIELNTYNLLAQKRKIKQYIDQPVYEQVQSATSMATLQYLSLRLSYTLTYGQKTRQTPKYQRGVIESAILL